MCILETERLLLRRFTLDDLDEICRLVYAGPVVKSAWTGVTGSREEIKARFAQGYIVPGGDFALRRMLKDAEILISAKTDSPQE